MLNPVLLSLKVASIATVFAMLIGIPLAYSLTNKDFKGKTLLETLLTLPLVLPPTVIGYGLLILFGRNSLLGRMLKDLFGIQVVFTVTGSIIAATVVALPLMIQSVKSAFGNLDPIYEKSAATLGSNKFKVFFTIILPLSWTGIVSGLVMSFARALGEFGATLMIAGNIPGKTQTIPIAIYSAVETGNKEMANRLVIIMTLFSFLVIWLLNQWLKRKHYIKMMREEKC
ncbi:molybdate ABC transporter permease subunit [Alkaliphilus sp. MSJ-5]|uniref:Molybdenum transport system permease n=1 Tax=Alkaliphilus flagellatus TaxID=2841507 RepID=A0ABS6G5X2_9FIRM|nr:molybdate ABC transporter permease subunit [Alkaliphilus flagellatus]MBU5676771.1 molybdate ABC transporter permease subunit [Alkaliphilus flagellatus]